MENVLTILSEICNNSWSQCSAIATGVAAIATGVAAIATFVTAGVICVQTKAAKREFSLTSILNVFLSLYDGKRLACELKKIKILKRYNLNKEDIPTIIGILDLIRQNSSKMDVEYYIRLLFNTIWEPRRETIFKIYAGYLCARNPNYGQPHPAYYKFLGQVTKALNKRREWKKYIVCFKPKNQRKL